MRTPWLRQMYNLASVASPVGTAEESMPISWVQSSLPLVIFLGECQVNTQWTLWVSSSNLIVHICSLSRWLAVNRV